MKDEEKTKEQLIEELTALRRRVEELESEGRFRTLIERVPDAVIYIHALDEPNALLYISPQVEKLLGYTAGELQQHPGGWLSCIHSEDRERVLSEFKRCQETGHQFSAEYRVVKKDGELIWLHDVAEMLPDETGRHRSILGITFDISPRKRAEEALRASEARYRNIFEHATEGIFQTTSEGRYVSINPAFARMFGYSSVEAMMAAISDIGGQVYVYPEDRERLKKLLAEESRVEGFETQVYRRDGRIIWISINARAVRDATGAILYFEGTNEEITKRKRAEEELEKLASVVKHSSEFINLATLDGKMIFLNDAGARVLGIDPEDIEQTGILEVIPDHLREMVQNELLPTVIEDGAWEGDLQCRNLKTGKLTDVHTMAFIISDPDTGVPRFLANISVDITERKKAEEALQESQRQLEDILALLPDATLVIDRDGKVIAWNLAMEEMTGVKKEDMLGKSKDVCAIALHGRPRSMLVDLVLDNELTLADVFDHLVRRGNTFYAEMLVPGIYDGKGGTLWSTASPLCDRQGNVIGAIESLRDITERKEMETMLHEREKELEAKSLDLEEINTALRVLLKRREEDQKDFAASVLSNLKELVFPYLEKLRESALNDLQRTYLSVMAAHLEEISTPFLRNLSHEFANLSRTERRIASLIKEGKRNREISEILGVSVNTILTHRYHLRTKLGLKNKKINLISYLKSINTL